MTTEKNILTLAEAKTNGDSTYAYAFGFVWAMLTPEQKATLDQYALNILAEESN